MVNKRVGAFALMILVACQSQNVSTSAVDAVAQETASESTGTDTDKLSLVRPLRYKPEGTDFIIINGNKRFNRALYGTGTAFRVETGDLPEFLMYMPNKGGNLKLGIATEVGDKWLIDATYIKAIYRPGTMLYEIKDPLLGEGQLNLQVLAMAEEDGMVVSLETTAETKPFELIWTYGGASGHRPARDGDIGADPEEGFYLHPEHCKGNVFEIKENSFLLGFEIGKKNADNYEVDATEVEDKGAQIYGVVAPGTTLNIGDVNKQSSPKTLLQSGKSDLPVVVGRQQLKGKQKVYFGLQNNLSANPKTYQDLPKVFNKADAKRKKVASQVKIETPDPYLNTLGGALSIAADAIWDGKSYMHGAIAWRMPLNGWRGAYVADALGWHDRARTHFQGYSEVQVTSPASGPVVPDPEKNWARQKEEIGISLYTNGYISRNPGSKKVAHHYDMNMVFIDEMLRHFLWTGDKAYLQEAWPIIERHLAWEKRNFDTDNDGLYDAYASFWASDAVQYSGGGVTHSSSYHYYSNKTAARLATLLGKDPEPYKKEAEKIKKAIGATMWIPEKGWYAEFKDLLGLQKLHSAAALWTVYHTLDSEVPDPFQAYQTLRYVDTQIPHIPIRNSDLPNENLVTLATTKWMPYTWSVNNVALAEVAHTALAYWQAGRIEEANRLMRSILIESMYMGSSPGNLQQLSYYDHYRGELYRDFADGIGISSRALVEGMFGILPDMLAGELTIRPGLPADWDHASFETPDIKYAFRREGDKETYKIEPHFAKPLKLKFRAAALKDKVAAVTVNGRPVKWTNFTETVGKPQIEITPALADKYEVSIVWAGDKLAEAKYSPVAAKGAEVAVDLEQAQVMKIKDPQKILTGSTTKANKLEAKVAGEAGHHTFFMLAKQGDLSWWEPVNIEVREPYKLIAKNNEEGAQQQFILQNNTSSVFNKKVTVIVGNNSQQLNLQIKPFEASAPVSIPSEQLRLGTNKVQVKAGTEVVATGELINWNLALNNSAEKQKLEVLDLSSHYNDKVTQIFQNKYLSPRPVTATLQLPTQGIGNWCYPLVTAEVDDTGLRAKAGESGILSLPNGLLFKTAGPGNGRNILFTSQWDNYPEAATIPLTGSASHVYLLMAGSTNPMQSRFDNGEVVVIYADNSQEKLVLRNPETWWPIEQDYYTNNYSFTIDKPKPIRVHLKSGEIINNFKYSDIKGFAYNSYIPGGATTVLDLPLDPNKKLKSLEVKSLANDVVIGLMGLTLLRDQPTENKKILLY